MANFDTDSFSEAELEAEFDRLFPQGFAGPDVLQELAPAGWESSPLLAVFHPPHELFPWEYAMTRKPPPNPRHCSWMPEELFP